MSEGSGPREAPGQDWECFDASSAPRLGEPRRGRASRPGRRTRHADRVRQIANALLVERASSSRRCPGRRGFTISASWPSPAAVAPLTAASMIRRATPARSRVGSLSHMATSSPCPSSMNTPPIPTMSASRRRDERRVGRRGWPTGGPSRPTRHRSCAAPRRGSRRTHRARRPAPGAAGPSTSRPRRVGCAGPARSCHHRRGRGALLFTHFPVAAGERGCASPRVTRSGGPGPTGAVAGRDRRCHRRAARSS